MNSDFEHRSRLHRLRGTEKAKRVSFFRNGDYFAPGVKLAIKNNKPFATLGHLCEYLSQRIHMPAKTIYSTDGRIMRSIEDLQDGESYVVVSEGKFQPAPYGSVSRIQTSHVNDALPMRQDDLQLLRAAPVVKKSVRRSPMRQNRNPLEGRLLTIAVRNGGAQATVLFNDRFTTSFEDTLKQFSRTLGLKRVGKMSTASGRQIQSLSQLKNEFRDEDTLFLDEDEYEQENSFPAKISHHGKSGKQRQQTAEIGNKSTKQLSLEWVHGYGGGDLIVLSTGELVYAAAAVIVLYRRTDDNQRHYFRHTEDVCSLCTHPSGRMVASGQGIGKNAKGAEVHVWITELLQTVAVVGRGRMVGPPISISFSSHDYILMSIEVGEKEIDCLTLWDWESDAMLARMQMKGESLKGGAFYPTEPDLAVTFGMHHLAFWRRGQDGLLRRKDALAPGHSGRSIESWAFVGDNELAVGDSTGYLTLWALLPGDQFQITKEVKAHQSQVSSLLLLSESTLVSGGDDELKVWDTERRLHLVAIAELPKDEGEVVRLSNQRFGDVSLFVGTTGNSILEGSMQSNFRVVVQGTANDIIALETDPDGFGFVTIDKNQHISKWTNRNLRWRIHFQVYSTCLALSVEGRALIVGGSNGKLFSLHTENGLGVATVSVADEPLNALAYSIDGEKLAIGSDDGNIYVCSSQNHGFLYKMLSVLKSELPILQLDWSLDSEYLQSVSRDDEFYEVTLWKVDGSKRINSAQSEKLEWPYHTCTLSHNIIGIWKELKGVFYTSCHRNESFIATGAQDGNLRVFNYPCRQKNTVKYEEWKQSSRTVVSVRFLTERKVISAAGTCILTWNFSS